MKEHILPAIKLTLVFLVLFSGVYTLVIWGIAQAAGNHGRGFVISHGDKTYYENIAQNFSSDKYFWSRPSAVNYNAAGAGGSNKGPGNPDYLKEVQARIDTFLVHNPGIERKDIPSELITASGSGLDPDISVKSALIQVNRISRARSLANPLIEHIIAECTQKPLMGLFGTEKVNVLKLNIALDNLKK